MKRVVIITLVMMLALMQVAAAAPDRCGDGTDPLKFETGTPVELDTDSVSVGDTFILPIPNSNGNVTIEITEIKDEDPVDGIGEIIAFNWTSDEAVCKYLVKSSTVESGWIEVNGDTEGSGVTPAAGKAVSHISFCFGCDYTINEVPEFPLIALPVAAIIGLAFFFQRRKE